MFYKIVKVEEEINYQKKIKSIKKRLKISVGFLVSF